MLNLIDNKEIRYVTECNYNQFHNVIHIRRNINDHVIFYMLEGEWEIYEEDKAYQLEKDSLIFLHSNHTHYGLRRSSDTIKTCYIHFNKSDLDKWVEENTDDDDNSFYIPTVVNCKNNQMVKEYFDQIIRLYYSNDKYKDEQIRGLFFLLLSELSKQAKNDTPKSKIVKNTLDIIHASINKFFSIEELARANYVCPKTLSSTFKKETGETIHQYQTTFKMKLAENLIKHQNLSLKNVAEQLGYCDEYHFSKVYKKYYNRTPKKGDK